MTRYIDDDLLELLAKRSGYDSGPGSMLYQPDSLPGGAPEFGIDDMMMPPEPEPMQRKGPGFLSKLKAGLPSMIEGGLAAVASPNTALGGPSDIARGILSGMGYAQNNRDARQDRAAEQQRRNAETEAELQLRRNQAAAAEAVKQRAMRDERYIMQGGVFLDKHTGRVIDPKEGNFLRAFDNRRKALAAMGKDPNSPEGHHYMAKGEFPDWYGKPETTNKDKPPVMVRLKRTLAEKYGIDNIPEGATSVDVPEASARTIWTAESAERREQNKPKTTPGAMTDAQRINIEDRRKKDAEARVTNARKEITAIETEENKYHAIREESGRDMSDETKRPVAIDKFNAATRALRNIYRRKLQIGAITQEQHDQLKSQLEEVKRGGSTQAPATAAPAAPPAAKSKYGTYVPGRGLVR